MSNIATGMVVLSQLIGVAIQALNATIQVQTILRRAQDEGRDVSDDELAQLKSQSDTLTEQLRALVQDGKVPDPQPPPA